MEVGLQMIFASYGWENIDDGQVFKEEVEMAKAAESLGFGTLWPVEHHFFDYSHCPDNLLFLSHMAAATKTIKLGTAAIILPWNDPIRVAEKVSMLDHLSGGRMQLGFGRGLSKREFAPFNGIEMEESRERFDESSAMIVEALETGFIEGNGKFYATPKTEIRPRPNKSFKNRLYAVSNSDDSVDSCAKIGGRMIMFAETDWKNRMPSIERHRKKFKEQHGSEAPPVMIADFTYCHEDESLARERAENYLASYLASILDHYDLMGEHLALTKGYERYGAQAGVLREIGFDKYVEGFLASNAYGTPQQILDRLRARYEIVGAFDMATAFRYGGIPYDQAQTSMKLFAEKIMPEVKSWT
ncbi:MAG: LLM class flavin-dependent oxidoreductase [Pseudomonadales bacterium]|nr:LLM class flavin-dependent oxidoreductase [Pseudomonadales bacterium]